MAGGGRLVVVRLAVAGAVRFIEPGLWMLSPQILHVQALVKSLNYYCVEAAHRGGHTFLLHLLSCDDLF
uniref:Uncharacterized protein n=1 Tax=Setaria viridis TaxID=4556 RepID=A0A4U6TZW0_SETVI|nr:hypothetical protein SEVIR_6G000375v2 [Setaria viridis]